MGTVGEMTRMQETARMQSWDDRMVLNKTEHNNSLRMFQKERAGRPEGIQVSHKLSQWFCEFNVSSSKSRAGRKAAQPGSESGTEGVLDTQ